MLGSPILYLKGMRIMMFQLSGFYCKDSFPAEAGRLPNALRQSGRAAVCSGFWRWV